MKLRTITLTVMATAVATLTQAQDGVGTISFVEGGTPSISPGTSINEATSFTIGKLVYLSDSTGYFASVPDDQNFGPTTFTLNIDTSFSFNNPVFGSFTSTSITVETSTPGFLNLHILGNYTSGSFDAYAIVADPASVDYTFTQNPPATGGISDAGVLSIPPTATPEPGSLALLGVGATALCVHLRRRQA